MTFKNVVIDFSGGVFAGGQAYVALSRCTRLEGITLRGPIKRKDIFVKSEVANFAKHFNNESIIQEALSQSKADKEYYDAAKAFDKGDFESFLDNFFLAIHSRYDIEKPVPKRLLRRKLHIINQLKEENKNIREKFNKQNEFLKKLSMEYVIMGKECEREGMNQAAINNYKKSLELCPENPKPKNRIAKLLSQNSENSNP